ncbi:MAG TPA: quinone-dependent dihydroorotate dehydrogenase, partial [Trueperaceae bacterium]
MYSLIKPFLFRQDPEVVHGRVMAGLAWAGRHPGALRLLSSACRVVDPRLRVERFGLTFPNPIGLAAGLDKNAVAVSAWPALGFGFAEIGSLTAVPQPGNPRPRLFRLPEDEALINRMGFNNEGAEVVAARLARLAERWGRPVAPLGINVGKSKVVPLEDAAADYGRSLEVLAPYASYFVLNVSSPNTPGLRELQDRDRLEELLSGLRQVRRGLNARPVLLKISPDLGWPQVDEVVELALAHGVSGLIATNTTLAREGLRQPAPEAGGLSGRPLKGRSLEFLRYLRATAGGQLPIVSVGGIFT